MERQRSFGLADLALLVVVVIWGANHSIAKSAMQEFQPLVFGSLRFLGASLLLLAFTQMTEHSVSVPRKDWRLVFVLGFVGNCLYQLFFISGLARTTATNSGLILGTSPIFVALLGTLMGTERLYGRNWVGIVLSFAGLFLLITGSGDGLRVNSQTITGDILILCATAAWAAYTVLFKGISGRMSTLKATVWTMSVAVPFLFLFAVRQYPQQNWQTISASSWLGLAFSTTMAIAFCYVVWNSSVKRVGSARTSIYSYLTPLVSVIVAWILLGEALSPLQWMGALFSLGGVVLARYHPSLNGGTEPA